MTESEPKRYYERIKESLAIIAPIITIIVGLLTITTYFYIPYSVAFEIVKYSFLIMIPITVSAIAMQIVLRDIDKKIKAKSVIIPPPDSGEKMKQLDKRMKRIETDIGKMSTKFSHLDTEFSSAISYINNDIKTFKKYFAKCPNCSNPMFLPILPSMVKWKKTHEKDGAPVKFEGDPEIEIGCPSCKTTWHIVFRE